MFRTLASCHVAPSMLLRRKCAFQKLCGSHKTFTSAAETVMKDYKGITYAHSVKVDVKWGDMDAFGHVNNTVYFK